MPRLIHGLALGAGPLAIAMSGQAIADNAQVAAVIKRLDNPFWLFSGSGVLSGRHDGRAAKALGW